MLIEETDTSEHIQEVVRKLRECLFFLFSRLAEECLKPPIQSLRGHVSCRDDGRVRVDEPESDESSMTWLGGILELE